MFLRQNRDYSFATVRQKTFRLIRDTPHLKCTKLKLTFICLCLFSLYFFARKQSTPINPISIPDRTKFNAFIITENCSSIRFNATKTSIEIAFPNFFTFICHPYVSLNNSRIDVSEIVQMKIYSSNLITFVDIWTKEIPQRSTSNEHQWSFIFEDDVDIINASSVSLPNFIQPLRQLMFNVEIERDHGFFYLGLCQGIYDNDSQPIIFNQTSHQLLSRKGCGFCRHATAITTQRAELFWTEISSYRPGLEGSIDHIFNDYCQRGGTHFYTFGANIPSPFNSLHTGIAFQNHKRFISPRV